MQVEIVVAAFALTGVVVTAVIGGLWATLRQIKTDNTSAAKAKAEQRAKREKEREDRLDERDKEVWRRFQKVYGERISHLEKELAHVVSENERLSDRVDELEAENEILRANKQENEDS